jgi:zinc protease
MERSGARRAAVGKGAHGARFRAGGEGPAGGGAGGADAIIERALTLAPVRTVLANGLTVLVLRRGQAPVFNAQVSFENGRLGEEAPGLDALTGALIDEGTTKRSAEQIAQAIGAVGGSVNAGPGGVTVRTLSKDAALALEVLAEVTTQPAFSPDAVERLKKRQVSEIGEELDTPRARGQLAFDHAVYGEHPYGRFGKGTPESVAALTREQVLAHYARFWTPKNALLAIVSDRDPAEVTAMVGKAFGGWTGGDAPKPAPAAPPAPKAEVLRVDLERAQTNVFVGHLGIVRSDPDYLALEVMDNVFGVGSGFTDRLSKTIRDQAGLAYTVFGSIARSATKVPGTFLMYAGTTPEDAERARQMMLEQLQGLLDRPPTPDELAGAKAAMRGGMVMGCESGSGLLGVLWMCERYALGFDYPKRYVQDLEKVTAEDVSRVARAHLHPDALTQVIVGPAAPPEKPVPTGAGAGR